MKTLNLGNNESLVKGIFAEADGWLVLGFTFSKFFKTFKGAERYARKMGVI